MIGCRIFNRGPCVAQDVVQAFQRIPVANASDCMSRMFAAGPGLLPMRPGSSMSGAALTVRTRPGDNLLIHKALDMASPGDVLVVDGGGDLTNSLIGELMVQMALSRKVAGLVINGAVRDAAALRESPLPVFAKGVTHRGPYKSGPGEINVPVSIGGMLVAPGDLVIGDDDGVLAIPIDQAPGILQAALAKAKAEDKMMREIVAGTYSAAWVDVELQKIGCVLEQGSQGQSC